MKSIFRQFTWELRRLLKQRRVWLGIGIIITFEIVFAMMMVSPSAVGWTARTFGQLGRTFDQHFTALTLASVLFAAATTYATPIFFIMMAADIAAGENGRGTLRALLCRPVSRTRVLLQKLAAACVVNIAITLLVAALAVILGHLLLPRGRMYIINAEENLDVVYAYADGLLLFSWAAGFLALSNLTASAVGFAWSCLPVRPGAAAAGALAVILLENQIRHFPAFHDYWPWFVTTRVSQWMHVFDPVINWPRLLGDYAFLAVFDVACVALGCWLFSRRDLKP